MVADMRAQLAPATSATPAPDHYEGAEPRLNRRWRPYLFGAAILPIVAMLYWGRGVIIPVALAALLTFLLSPIVNALERAGAGRVPGGRVAAVILVVVLVFTCLAGTGWIIAQQVLALGSELPKYRGNLIRKISDIRLTGKSGGLVGVQSTARDVMGELQKGQTAKNEAPPVPVVVKSDPWQFPKVLEGLGIAAFVVVLLIFMLIEQHEIRNRFIRLAGHGRLARVTRALDEAAERIGRYLVAQTVINAAFAALLATGLSFIGVPYVVMWGFLAFTLRFIPYVGPSLTAAGVITLSLAVFTDWQRPLMAAGLFLAIELLMYMLVEPYFFGRSIGVSQVALLVALGFWTWLWGPIGLVLGTPLTVCLVVLGKHVPALGFIAVIMADEPMLPVGASYYQRLLARDRREGDEILGAYLAEHSLEETYDDAVIPALSHTKRDRAAKRISEEEAQAVYTAVRETAEKCSTVPLAVREERKRGWRRGATTPHVLAVATGGQGDGTALAVLCGLIPPSVCVIQFASMHAEPDEIASMAANDKPTVILLAALAPKDQARVNDLCRCLRAACPTSRIVVGLWGGGDSDVPDREALRSAGSDDIGTTLCQSRDDLLEALSSSPTREEVTR